MSGSLTLGRFGGIVIAGSGDLVTCGGRHDGVGDGDGDDLTKAGKEEMIATITAKIANWRMRVFSISTPPSSFAAVSLPNLRLRSN